VDLSALVLGGAASLAWRALWSPLASLLGVTGDGFHVLTPGGPVPAQAGVVLRTGFFEPLLSRLAFPGTSVLANVIGAETLLQAGSEPGRYNPTGVGLAPWKSCVVALVVALFAAIAGGAVSRVYALRKARDRSIPAGEALGFVFSNLASYVRAPLFILAAIALFTLGGLAGGALTAVPFAGPVLQFVGQPVAFLCAVITTILVVGGTLGFPLLIAALSVERNGSLDAVSRAYSYAYGRPVTYGIGAFLVVSVGALLSGFGSWCAGLSREFLLSGAGFVDDGAVGALRAGLAAVPSLSVPRVEGGGMAVAWAWGAWSFGSLFMFLAQGFVFSYVVGGFTDLYFLLREEVEGTALREVFVEGEGEAAALRETGAPKDAAS
jgi:hypothetical protein